MTDARDRVLALLDEPGSRTKASLQDQLAEEFEATEVTRALGKLLHAGEIEEHPEIDGAYRVPSDSDPLKGK